MTTSAFHVFADIETDGLRVDRLLQIAAVTEQNDSFNVYINPRADLPLSCTNLCGLYYFKGNLHKDGKLLPSVGVRTALLRFKDWIEKLEQEITLVFHNGFSFDCYVLAKYFIKFKVEIPRNVKQIGDTLPSFRKHLKEPELLNHRLTSLAVFFDLDFPGAHDALQDSKILKAICEKAAIKTDKTLADLLEEYCKKFSYFVDKENERKNRNTHTNPNAKK